MNYNQSMSGMMECSNMSGMMGNMHHSYFSLIHILSFVVMVLIIALTFYLFRSKKDTSSNISINSQSHINILNERLAKGEIDIEEYQKVKEVLLGNS